MAAKTGQDTHQLWGDGSFHVRLDLSQVSGLSLELIFNLIVILETSIWLISR